jgi:hypothetical protein
MRRADTSSVCDLQQSDADCDTYPNGYSNAYSDGNRNTYSYRYTYSPTDAHAKISADTETAPNATPPLLICM